MVFSHATKYQESPHTIGNNEKAQFQVPYSIGQWDRQIFSVIEKCYAQLQANQLPHIGFY